MFPVAVAVLAALALSPPFGEASAVAVPDGRYVAVTVEVQVDPAYTPDYVVVHVLNPEGQETFPLGRVAGDRYSGTFTILPFNRAVVFEAGREGESVVSPTVSLLDLGVDVDRLKTIFDAPGSTAGTRKWGWLALAAAALAGAGLLAYWVWPSPGVPAVDGGTLVVEDE